MLWDSALGFHPSFKIPEHPIASQSIPKHPKASQSIPKHPKVILLPDSFSRCLGIPFGIPPILQDPRASQSIPKHPRASQSNPIARFSFKMLWDSALGFPCQIPPGGHGSIWPGSITRGAGCRRHLPAGPDTNASALILPWQSASDCGVDGDQMRI